jgi:hypothetical protein
MDDTDAFRLQHNKKISFFNYHQRFFPSSHSFRNDTRLFLKCKTVRKGSLKRKFKTNIIKMLNDLKCQEQLLGVLHGEEEPAHVEQMLRSRRRLS